MTIRKEALSVQEVAEMLGLHTNTVYRRVDAKEIPSFRVAGRVLIPRKWVDELLDAGTT